MKNDPSDDPLREVSWRRKLTPAEQAELAAWLASHPETQADWDEEIKLSEALTRLPEAPVPSNFTSRVLQAVERESATVSARQSPWWLRWNWLAKAGAAVAIVVLGGLGVYWQNERAELARRAQAVSQVSGVASLPGPEILQDFDAIYVLNAPPGPDDKLLTLFQ